MKGLFNLNWANVKSAIIYGLLSIAVAFIFSIAESVLNAHTIFGLDWKHIIDQGVVAGLGIFVTLVSLVKNLLTTEKGNFMGITEVIPDKE